MAQVIDYKVFKKRMQLKIAAAKKAMKEIEKTPRDDISIQQLIVECKMKKQEKGEKGQLIDLNSRRSPETQKQVIARINAGDIKEEAEQNTNTTVFEGSHQTRGKAIPRSLIEIKRFLGTLNNNERIKVERLVEDIALDARVRDRSFTCTMTYMRVNKDPEISTLYEKIRAAIFANIGVMLPEIPDETA